MMSLDIGAWLVTIATPLGIFVFVFDGIDKTAKGLGWIKKFISAVSEKHDEIPINKEFNIYKQDINSNSFSEFVARTRADFETAGGSKKSGFFDLESPNNEKQ
jgi:hypothetical protein